jgi:hypothetical protein
MAVARASSNPPSSSLAGTPIIVLLPCRALRDARALLGASLRCHRALPRRESTTTVHGAFGRALETRLGGARTPRPRLCSPNAHPQTHKIKSTANPRQNARLFDKYDANRRALGGEAVDPAEADARTLRQLRQALLPLGRGDGGGGGGGGECAPPRDKDPGPMLVDVRRVAAMAAFYRVLPDEADDPDYAEDSAARLTTITSRRSSSGKGGGSLQLLLSPGPPPPPPRSLPDCLSARDPAAAAALDARVRSASGALGVRGAVVRPLDDDDGGQGGGDDGRWQRAAAEALLAGAAAAAAAARGDPPSRPSAAAAAATRAGAAAFILWDVESAPLPPDADPRAAARLLEALVGAAAAAAGSGGGDSDSGPAAPPHPRLSVFGTRPALARIPAAFVARYAVSGAPTARGAPPPAAGPEASAAAAAAAAAAATSLGARCAAYYCSRGLVFEPARGAQPSLKYALRREGAEVVQVGGGGGGGGGGLGARGGSSSSSKGAKRKGKRGAAAAAAAATMAPADALAEAAERLLAVHSRLRARALFEEEGDGRQAPPALLLAVVAGAGELEATGLGRRLREAAAAAAGGVVPLLVVAGGGGGGNEQQALASPSDQSAPSIVELSWESLLRRRS